MRRIVAYIVCIRFLQHVWLKNKKLPAKSFVFCIIWCIFALHLYKEQEMSTIFDFSVKDRKGKSVALKEYAPEVLLIVNTAIKCGFTPQYEELEKLYEKYHSQGFEILDFPCNQFGQQAPGTDESIHQFCKLNYGTEFPRFKKVKVNGDDADPLFKYLKEQKGFQGWDMDHKLAGILDDMLKKDDPDSQQKPDIKWHFTKFLTTTRGMVVDRFEPTTSIEVIEERIQQLLHENI